MGIFNDIINKLRRSNTATDSATPQTAPDEKMAELAQKLADKRGDNVSIGGAEVSGNAAERLAAHADMAGIVTSSGEDDVISGS